jgi:Lysozyme like domain
VQSAGQGSSGGSSGGLSGTLSCSGLEQLWDSAGGNPSDAFMAAEIAEAESGGNQYALSPTDDYGYWQINGSNGALATFNAYGNARSAIILSDDGSNWNAWTTYHTGAYEGRC